AGPPLLRRAEEDRRFLGLVVEDEVELPVAVEVGEGGGLRVEHLLRQAEALRLVLELAVAEVLEVAVRAAEAADDEVRLAVVVEVAPGGGDGARDRLRQVAARTGHVAEHPGAVVAIEAALAVDLRHEQVEVAVAVEVAQGGADLAGLVGDA